MLLCYPACRTQNFNAEIPWNQAFSRNIRAKSCARITYRQNPHFNDLSGRRCIAQPVPNLRSKTSLLSDKADR